MRIPQQHQKTFSHLVLGSLIVLGSLLNTACSTTTEDGIGIVGERRSTGTMLDDQSIENMANSTLRNAIQGASEVSVVSYNRKLLLVGQVTSDADRVRAERAAQAIPNVGRVYSEITVTNPIVRNTVTEDAYITTKLRARLVDAQGVPSNAIKVYTAGNVVYLFGLVTKQEGELAAKVASTTTGVRKVLTFFENVNIINGDARSAPIKQAN